VWYLGRMQGVTTALVAFVLLCVVYPHLVKVKAQFYIVVAMICGMIVLDALGLMINGTELKGFRVFAYFAVAVLQVLSLVGLFLSCGGLSLGDLTGEMKGAIEVMRRGESGKEIIIPLTGEVPKAREEKGGDRIVIPAPAPAVPAVTPPGAAAVTGSVPLE
jgi:hypothetical protein